MKAIIPVIRKSHQHLQRNCFIEVFFDTHMQDDTLSPSYVETRRGRGTEDIVPYAAGRRVDFLVDRQLLVIRFLMRS